jgi:uncharacterized protein (DUF983 family)
VARDLLDRPSFAWRALRTVWLVLRLRCPVCGLGRIATGPFTVSACCGACGVTFERDPGEVTGGIWVNSFATTLGICTLALWLEIARPLPPVLETPFVVLFAAAFPLAFYRHSRALWIGLLHVTGLVHRDEAADPEPVIHPWPSDRGGGGAPPPLPDPIAAPQVVAAGAGRPGGRVA